MSQFARVVNGQTELAASLFNDLQEAIEQQSFNVMRYGAVGDGVTDDTAAIQAAIDAAAGQPVFFVSGMEYYTETGITTDGDLFLVGNATITHSNSCRALTVAPAWGTAYDIDSFDIEVFPTSAAPCAKLELDEYAEFSRGDVVLVYSDDTLVCSSVSGNRGELRMVAGTAAGYVYLNGILDDAYSTNPKIRKHPMTKVTIDGLTFSAASDPTTSESTRPRTTVELIGCGPETRVKATFKDTWSRGLFLVSCYGGLFDLCAKNCRDDLTNFAYGYGIDVCSASRFCRVTIEAENCRHAITSNDYPPIGDGYYGAPRNVLVFDSVAHSCTSNSFDTHPSAYDWVFDSCHVFHQNEGDATSPGQRFAFQARGANITIQNCTHAGFGNFLADYSANSDHDVESLTLVRNCSSVATDAEYAVEQGQILVVGGTADVSNKRLRLEGFYSKNRKIYVSSAGTIQVDFDNCYFENAPLLRMAAGTTVTMRNCTRESTSSVEPILVRAGCTLELDNYKAIGPHGNNSMIRGADGPGNWNVKAANLSSPTATVGFRTDDGSGTWAVTDTAVTVS